MAESSDPIPCANLKPMRDWISEDGPGCLPCRLGPTTQWYISELEEKGCPEDAAKLEALATGSDPLSLCQEMDEIKGRVSPELRSRLLDFDCATQSYIEGGE